MPGLLTVMVGKITEWWLSKLPKIELIIVVKLKIENH